MELEIHQTLNIYKHFSFGPFMRKYRISPDPTISIILACQYGAPLSVGFKCHTLFHASVYMLWCSWLYVQSLSQPFSKIFHPSTNLN